MAGWKWNGGEEDLSLRPDVQSHGGRVQINRAGGQWRTTRCGAVRSHRVSGAGGLVSAELGVALRSLASALRTAPARLVHLW